jgi:hypothetical protein
LAIGGLDTALTLQDAHASFRLPTPVLSKFAALERPATVVQLLERSHTA